MAQGRAGDAASRTNARSPGQTRQDARIPARRNARRNFAPSTIWTGDNLDVLRGLNSDTVDLIYLDPPFNSKADYAAPVGSRAAGAAFKDTWGLSDINLAWHGLIKSEYPALYDLLKAVRGVHGPSMMSYLIYMAPRLMEMKRVLKATGSLYLHCDPTASHYLKLMLDAVFGTSAFRNEIVWCYTGPSAAKRHFPKKHDTLFCYSSDDAWTFNASAVKVPYKKRETGRTKGIFKKAATLSAAGKVPETWWTRFSPVGRIKRERTGYPTQKPLALLRRIIAASSNEGDLVLDPFCGCATALIAAQELHRRWVGIDISPKAAELVETRMRNELGLFFDGHHRTDIPLRSDLGQVRRYNSTANKQRLYGEQGGYCLGCGEHFTMRNLTVDHIVPRAKGGTDHLSNLQLLCGACNSMKGTRSHEELIARLTDKGWKKRQAAQTPGQTDPRAA